MTKRFFIVEPFATSNEYFYILNDIRNNWNQDIEIHAIFTKPTNTYFEWALPSNNFPVDKVWFIETGYPQHNNSDILIAGSDAGVPYVSNFYNDNKIRHRKNLYLEKIDSPHKIEHFCVTDLTINDGLNWAIDKLPVVIKPVDGSGSRDVFMIYSIPELSAMLNYTMIDKGNYEYLIQKKIKGKEYQFDISSCNGELNVVAIWSAYRSYRGYSWLENYDDMSDVFKKSLQSLLEMLKKLDIVYGLYHVETMFDGNDLKVIEINFRNHGHIPQPAYKTAVGLGHIEADVVSHLWPNFWKSQFSKNVIQRKKFMARCWIKNFKKRYLELDINQLKIDIPTIFHVMDRKDLYGRVVDPSLGFFSTHVAAIIIQDDNEQVVRDSVQMLFNWAEDRYGL